MVIQLNNTSKTFSSNNKSVTALDQISLDIEENSYCLIKGPSGCGKSTLLFTMGGMLKPSLGKVFLLGKDLYNLSEIERRKLTSGNIGFVFQSYHLLPYLNVIDNILIQDRLPFININNGFVMSMAEDLHLKDRLKHKPSELSIGEKQRVALIRSLASKPGIIFADEPTGNLDPENTEIVLSFLKKFKDDGGTVVMVTHNSVAEHMASRIISMKQGRIISN